MYIARNDIWLYSFFEDYPVFLLIINGSGLASALVVINNIWFFRTINSTSAVINGSDEEMKKNYRKSRIFIPLTNKLK
jgi:hypothetical protein